MLPREEQVERTGALQKAIDFEERAKEAEEQVDPSAPRYPQYHRAAGQCHHLPQLGQAQGPQSQAERVSQQ